MSITQFHQTQEIFKMILKIINSPDFQTKFSHSNRNDINHLETFKVLNGSTASRNGSLKYEVVTTLSATGGDTLFEIRPKHNFPVNIK